MLVLRVTSDVKLKQSIEQTKNKMKNYIKIKIKTDLNCHLHIKRYYQN